MTESGKGKVLMPGSVLRKNVDDGVIQRTESMSIMSVVASGG